jgi:hypothetical protein
MKKLNSLLILSAAVILSSCGTTYFLKPVGELSMVATRNIDKSVNYTQLKAYAGVSGSDLTSAIAAAKKGVIKAKNPIVKEINLFKATTLNQCVDNVVKSVAGGEYLYNTKFYLVGEVPFKLYGPKVIIYNYIASGDVWGVNDGNANIKGFKVNDKVVFTFTKELKKLLAKNFEGEVGKQYSGKVINLKSGDATVQLENSTVVDVPYTNLTNLH